MKEAIREAVSLEAPIILALSWYVARFWIGHFGVGSHIKMRIVMGRVAFAILLLS